LNGEAEDPLSAQEWVWRGRVGSRARGSYRKFPKKQFYLLNMKKYFRYSPRSCKKKQCKIVLPAQSTLKVDSPFSPRLLEAQVLI